jgi:DNA uptake protein ComE-like DNA-binding protein
MDKVKINLDNPMALQALPGLNRDEVEAILRFRAEHGPIQDPAQLARIVGGRPLSPSLLERVDFTPADATSPEAPGA